MKRLKEILLPILLMLAVTSCDNDLIADNNTDDMDRTIELNASLGEMMTSRSVQHSVSPNVLDEENYIIKGEYSILLYEAPFAGVHCCRFSNDKKGEERKGNIYLIDQTKEDKTPSSIPLKWSDLQNQTTKINSFKFTLDNIDYTEPYTYGRTWDEEDKKKYRAQKEAYDNDKKPIHTNDIIWGWGVAEYKNNGKDISYAELTHRMSRISAALVNLPDGMNKRIQKISVSNLIQTPDSFNRLTGTVSVAADAKREEFVLFDINDENNCTLTPTTEMMENETYVEYATANFILPPQLLDENNWPKLSVTYKTEKEDIVTVSGLVPHDIFQEEENSWEGLDALNAGSHLTIVGEIKEEIPDIIFTAKVRKWVELGPVVVNANYKQPGIYSVEDLKDFITLYNKQKENSPLYERPFELTRYGNILWVGSNIGWELKLMEDIEITEDLSEKLERHLFCGSSPVTINLNGKKFTYNGRTGNVTDIVKECKGINNKEELERCIELYNKLVQFERTVDGDITINYLSINQKIANINKELMDYGTSSCINEKGAINGAINWTFDINYTIGEDVPKTLFRWALCCDNMVNKYSTWTYPITFNDKAGNNDLTKLKGQIGIYTDEDMEQMIRLFNENSGGGGTDFVWMLYGKWTYPTDKDKNIKFTFDLYDDIQMPQKKIILPKIFKYANLEIPIDTYEVVINYHGFKIGGRQDVFDVFQNVNNNIITNSSTQ